MMFPNVQSSTDSHNNTDVQTNRCRSTDKKISKRIPIAEEYAKCYQQDPMEPQLNKLDPALELSTLGCSSTHLFSSLSYFKILFWSHYEKGGCHDISSSVLRFSKINSVTCLNPRMLLKLINTYKPFLSM